MTSMFLVVCGVAGAGKSTIGRMLADRLGCQFLDADDYHPESNVEKMRRGEALDDADRLPWIDRLADLIQSSGEGVLACSALKAAYRDRLGVNQKSVVTVFLDGSKEVIASRIADRQHEYFPASLLESQFDALEAPADGIRVSIDQPPESVTEEILAAIGKIRRGL